MALLTKSVPYFFFFLLMFSLTVGRPHDREKRSGISDQRLAEIETLIAMYKLNKNKEVTGPVAFGAFDPTILGKKKRSYRMSAFKNSHDSPLRAENTKNEEVFETPLTTGVLSLTNEDVLDHSYMDILHLRRLLARLRSINEQIQHDKTYKYYTKD
ncbi:uncharacterized protein LOC143253016 [Tachypleus tridentatus]|uniref:uncharacterized protein LOC143253016 n=1 Tax=Tachypleus tridentatus TaxID=6853 RepID=UPI003FD22D10